MGSSSDRTAQIAADFIAELESDPGPEFGVFFDPDQAAAWPTVRAHCEGRGWLVWATDIVTGGVYAAITK